MEKMINDYLDEEYDRLKDLEADLNFNQNKTRIDTGFGLIITIYNKENKIKVKNLVSDKTYIIGV